MCENSQKDDDSYYYWAQDHDATRWSQEFQPLAKAANSGKKKNKEALGAYRKMRMKIANQNLRMMRHQSSAPAQRAPLEAATNSTKSRRGGERHSDPFAVASHLDYALLIPMHHFGPSAEGDLESETFRRCRRRLLSSMHSEQSTTPSICIDLDVQVVRGLESSGYPVMAPDETWALRLVGYAQATKTARPSLAVQPGRNLIENVLVECLTQANARKRINGLVLTGVPFCSGSNDKEAKIAAELTCHAIHRAGITNVVLAGRYASESYKLFCTVREGPMDKMDVTSLSIDLWNTGDTG